MSTKATLNLCVICERCAVAVAVAVPTTLREERDLVLVLRGRARRGQGQIMDAWKEHNPHGASASLAIIQPASEGSRGA